MRQSWRCSTARRVKPSHSLDETASLAQTESATVRGRSSCEYRPRRAARPVSAVFGLAVSPGQVKAQRDQPTGGENPEQLLVRDIAGQSVRTARAAPKNRRDRL